MNQRIVWFFSAILVLAPLPAAGQVSDAARATAARADSIDAYGSLSFLIGRWENPNTNFPIVQEFRWGPKNLLIYWTAWLDRETGQTQNFEGVIVWNPITQNNEFFLSLVGGGNHVLETGRFEPTEDGTLLRHVEVRYAAGTPLPRDGSETAGNGGYLRHFRQSYRSLGPDEVETTVFFRAADGSWQPSFGDGRNRMVRVKDQ